MKNLILTLSVLTLSLTSYAQALPDTARQIMFDAISRDVYFEDDGYTRMPKALSDFTFTQTDEFEFSVSGTSFSDWDNKEIGYECTVTSLTRGMITSVNDIEVNCTLSNENWPNM